MFTHLFTVRHKARSYNGNGTDLMPTSGEHDCDAMPIRNISINIYFKLHTLHYHIIYIVYYTKVDTVWGCTKGMKPVKGLST